MHERYRNWSSVYVGVFSWYVLQKIPQLLAHLVVGQILQPRIGNWIVGSPSDALAHSADRLAGSAIGPIIR